MRFKYTTMIIFIIIIFLFPVFFQNNVIAEDWSRFRYDETNCGSTDTPGPKTNIISWKYNIGSPIYSSPVISGDKIFVGSDDAKLYTFNRLNGSLKWDYQTGSGITSKGIKRAPTVSKNKIFFGSRDSKLYALNKENGDVLWIHESDNWIDTTPAVANGSVFTESEIYNDMFDYKDLFCALDENTGKIQWQIDIGCSIKSAPAIHNNIIFVGAGFRHTGDTWPGGLYALNIDNGDILWNFTAGNGESNANVDTAPCVAYDKVYFGCNFGTIHALNENNGTEVWQYNSRFKISSPAAYDNKIYIGSQDGNLYAFNSETGDIVWTYKTNGSIDSSPAIAKGIVYIGSEDSFLYAIDAETGKLIWKYKTNGPIYSSPAIANGMVYIGCNDGYLYAFGENIPPTAVLKVHQDVGLTGDPIQFEGGYSIDPDLNTVIYYYFDFGDGSNSGWITTPTVTHEYNKEGTYFASLKVKDIHDDESENKAEKMITINKTTEKSKKDESSFIPGFDGILLVFTIMIIITIVRSFKRKYPLN